MADLDKISTRYHYQFIHHVFSHFMGATMDYFSNYLLPRTNSWQIVGTYDKAVEWINKQKQFAGTQGWDMPNRPGLILNPIGEMSLDETYGMAAGRFPNIAPGMTKYMFDPIYKDDQLTVTVGFSRIKGDIEILVLLPSFYEYFDTKILLLQMFRGMNRYIIPIWFNSFIIIPPELYNYTYTNEYTGQTYKIDWDNNGVVDVLAKTTNTNEKVYPCNVQPRFKMNAMSDVSTRLGGTENLPDWRLAFTLEYEIEIPSFIVLETDLSNNMNLDVNMEIKSGSTYSTYNYEIPQTKELLSRVTDSTGVQSIQMKTLEFHTRYYHIFVKEDWDSTSTTNLTITIPEVLEDVRYIFVNSKFGEMIYGDHYYVESDLQTLIVRRDAMKNLKVGDVLELYIYTLVVPS